MASKFLVCITACERPVLLANLLTDLVREKGTDVSLRVRVYDDASRKNMAQAQNICTEHGWMFIKQCPRHGKQHFSKVFTRIMEECKDEEDDTIIVVLPDDVRLCTKFFSHVEHEWHRIDDAAKRAMTLMVDRSRAGRGCWTGVTPREAGPSWLIQWVDGLFACTKEMFADLDWYVPDQPKTRWLGSAAGMSSGVGAYMSKKLNSLKRTMYRVDKSLVVHVDGPSVMNPERRDRGDMVTVRFIDGEQSFQRLRKA